MDLHDTLLKRRELRQRELDTKHAWEDLKDEREALDRQLYEHMEHRSIQGYKADGTNFVPTETTYANVQDHKKLLAWAEENDESLIEQKFRKGVLDEMVREKLENGEALPPGLGIHLKQTISQRAG